MRKLVSVIAALAMVATFAMSAAAADWNFYGSARIETFYVNEDVKGGDDTDNFSLVFPTNSRIGANVKVSDELTGRFEYGTGGSNANIRLLYGQWNFGAGSLLVGQDFTPVQMAFSRQMKDGNVGLIGYGAAYGGRHPQLKVRFGNFEIAAIKNVDLEKDVQAALDDLENGAFDIYTEDKFPKLEASYFHDLGPVRLRAQAGYATVDVEGTYDGVLGQFNFSDDIDAYIVALGATYTAGPFYATGSYAMGENLTLLGTANSTRSIPNVGADAETTMYYILAGFKFNDMVAIEAGWGREETEYDNVPGDKEVEAYYVTLPFTLAPGVFMIPEVGVFDTEDVDKTEKTYFGITWQINF